MPDYDLLSEEKKEVGLYLMELIGAALTQKKAKEKPEHISWEDVYKMAAFQSVEALSAYGLETLQDLPEEFLLKKWNEKKAQTLFKTLCFDAEREQIFADMATQGISYMSLKGVLISGYYPKPGMRSMADNDILYGIVEKMADGGYCNVGENEDEKKRQIEKAQQMLVRIMENHGFTTESLGGNHDVFLKKPFYNFEMHRKLVSSISEYQEYYKNSWARAIQDEKNPYEYHFSDEDEYLFFLVHMHKHFVCGGCGIRHLSDIYVFWQKKGFAMNRTYLKEEMEKLRLVEFEEEMRELAYGIFEERRKLSKNEQEILFFLLGCGTYGRIDVSVMRKIEKYQKEGSKSRFMPRLKYIWGRMFPDETLLKEYFPFFYGKPYLLPALLVYRVGKGLFIHPKRLWNEWKNIWKRMNQNERK